MCQLIRSVLTCRPALYGFYGGHGMVARLEDAVDAAGFGVFLDAIGAFLVCNISTSAGSTHFWPEKNYFFEPCLTPPPIGELFDNIPFPPFHRAWRIPAWRGSQRSRLRQESRRAHFCDLFRLFMKASHGLQSNAFEALELSNPTPEP
jgi:hypothetical protein